MTYVLSQLSVCLRASARERERERKREGVLPYTIKSELTKNLTTFINIANFTARTLSVDHSFQKILALPLSSFAILKICGLEWFLMVLRCGISHSVMLNTVEVRMLAGVGV